MAVGCDGDGSSAASADRATNTQADAATPTDIAGRWAHYDVVAYSDAAMKTLIISYGFTDFELRGNELFAQEVFCTARQASDQPIETEISEVRRGEMPKIPVKIGMIIGNPQLAFDFCQLPNDGVALGS